MIIDKMWAFLPFCRNYKGNSSAMGLRTARSSKSCEPASPLSPDQGSSEQRTEVYEQYSEGVAQLLTQVWARSIGRVWGFAPKRANAVRSWQRGFTIAELMIATSVFSIILLVALAGFLDIGHLFYKGVATTQTDTVANQIFTNITGNFQNATNISPPQTGNGYTYYCVGNNRYTYNIDKEVSASGAADHSAGGNYGLLQDTLPGSGNSCAPPCGDTGSPLPTCNAPAVRLNNPVEMLGDSMRLEEFSIQPNSNLSNYYNVSIVVAYGSSLNYTSPGPPPDYSTAYCSGSLSLQQFCSVSRLSEGIYKGAP